MSKNTLIAIGAAFVLSVAVTLAIIKFKRPAVTPSPAPLTSLQTPVSAPAVASEKTYQDESGFYFKYPSDLTVTDDTPDDNIHYSLLKLKHQDGTMMELVVKDIIQEPKFETTVVALNFGNMTAKQFRNSGRLVTAAVVNKILYQLTSPDTGYWQKIHSQIAASFVEGAAPAESVSDQSPASDTIYEVEEVVE